MRSGHTEAAVDLCKLAGLEPVGVICELVNDDGTVKRGAEVSAFSEANGLRRISVADLIAWRERSEKLVERVAEFPVTTHAGPARAFAYPHALRRHPAPRRRLRRDRRRPWRARAPASRVHR